MASNSRRSDAWLKRDPPMIGKPFRANQQKGAAQHVEPQFMTEEGKPRSLCGRVLAYIRVVDIGKLPIGKVHRDVLPYVGAGCNVQSRLRRFEDGSRDTLVSRKGTAIDRPDLRPGEG